MPDLSSFLAIMIVLALLAVPVMLAYRAINRTGYSLGQALLMGLNYVMTRVLWRTTIEGSFPFDRRHGAIIVSNHRCSLDPAFIALPLDRIVHWMVAKEYCVLPGLRWFFRMCACIPVNRGGVDTGATKHAIRLAQAGGLVGIFPEGRINTTGQLMLPGRPGAALIALKARVPVVPCYIEGSPYDGTVWGCLFMAARVRLVIGQSIDLSEYYGREGDRDVLEDVTRRLIAEIARLAGQPDFVPALAGRFYKPGLSPE